MSSLILLILSAGSWPDSLVTLELTFDWDQWQYACDHYLEDIWLEGVLDSDQSSFAVYFRIRGQTSRAYPKKSLKVEILDGELFGYSELNLNGQYLDRSRMRECLSYEFFRSVGICVPETGLVELVFNGETQGPYLFVQDVDADFAAGTLLPDDAVIYKARSCGSSLNQTFDLSLYRKKTFESDPWDDLELFIAWLVNSPDSMYAEDLESRVHLDQVASLIAVNVLIGHGSTYYHNYLPVLDAPGESGRWRLITWDMDRTWARSYGTNWPYYSSSNGSNHPNTLIWRSWCMAPLREYFLDRIWSLFDDFVLFAESGIIDSLETVLEPLVEIDPFRDYTMEEFTEEVNIVRSWPGARISNLQLMLDWPLPFHTNPVVLSGQDRLFTWTDAGSDCFYTLQISTDSLFMDSTGLVFETFTADTFTIVQGWAPPVPPVNLYWTVYASSSQKTEKALNWFRPLVPSERHPWSGEVVINEICCLPSVKYPSGDWVELVNTDADTVSLVGWSFRDGNNRHLHTIGSVHLPPGGHVVIYGDSLMFRSLYPICPVDDDGFDFNLSGQWDLLRLYDLSGRMIDRVDYLTEAPWPPLENGETLALIDPYLDNSLPESWRASQGGGTPGLHNDSTPQGSEFYFLTASPAYPSPCTGLFSVDLTVPEAGLSEIRLYDLSGRMVLSFAQLELVQGIQSLTVETGELPSGVYFLGIWYRGCRATVPVIILETE